MGWKDNLSFVPYGARFRKLRKMLKVEFEKEKTPIYRPIEEQESCVMLHNLLQNPAKMDRHGHRLVVPSSGLSCC